VLVEEVEEVPLMQEEFEVHLVEQRLSNPYASGSKKGSFMSNYSFESYHQYFSNMLKWPDKQ
jgi:hypothetical protein